MGRKGENNVSIIIFKNSKEVEFKLMVMIYAERDRIYIVCFVCHFSCRYRTAMASSCREKEVVIIAFSNCSSVDGEFLCHCRSAAF